MSRWLFCGAVMLLAAGCECAGTHADDGPCASARPPDTCDVACSGETPCPSGFYCGGAGVCTADCEALRPADGCPDGVCTAEGRCEPRARVDASVDASGVCADVRVQARQVTPNVILVVDQSGSMVEGFGDDNRWDALRDSLLGNPDGLVYSLSAQVRFGLALFSAVATEDSEPVPGECPVITWVPPAIDNFAAIEDVYSEEEPSDETPTGESLDAILDRLTMTPDPSDDPTIFILATDGEPDTCAQPNPQEGQDESLAAAERAYLAGIRTFVISVGEGTISESHLQDMANAGLGRDAGDPDAEFWVAGDDEGLRSALSDIIGGELSCLVTLEGEIQDIAEACSGTVELNGTPLPCNDPNGWEVVDETHIELSGEACETLQSAPGVTLEASFPCGVILI